MSILEARLESRLTSWLKKKKIKYKKKAHGELLDRWLLLPGGKPFIIELKRRGAKVNPKTGRRQYREIKDLRNLGYDVEVHDNFEEVVDAITLRLEARAVSEEGDKVSFTNRLRRSTARSRAKEDEYYARCR